MSSIGSMPVPCLHIITPQHVPASIATRHYCHAGIMTQAMMWIEVTAVETSELKLGCLLGKGFMKARAKWLLVLNITWVCSIAVQHLPMLLKGKVCCLHASLGQNVNRPATKRGAQFIRDVKPRGQNLPSADFQAHGAHWHDDSCRWVTLWASHGVRDGCENGTNPVSISKA